MAIAISLQKYLDDHRTEYDIVAHQATASSTRTAQVSHISGDRVAKAVIVKDDNGFAVAVVPATRHIRLGDLSRLLNRRFGLATEEEACNLFTDCEIGAFPAIGSAYGLEVVVDDSLEAQPDVYFEAGDHTSLIHVKADQFRKLTQNAPRGRFSVRD